MEDLMSSGETQNTKSEGDAEMQLQNKENLMFLPAHQLQIWQEIRTRSGHKYHSVWPGVGRSSNTNTSVSISYTMFSFFQHQES